MKRMLYHSYRLQHKQKQGSCRGGEIALSPEYSTVTNAGAFLSGEDRGILSTTLDASLLTPAPFEAVGGTS